VSLRTLRHRAEEERESLNTPTSRATSAEELALLIDYVQDYAIFILSPDGEIRSWNRGAERIFGYSADQAIGHKLFMFYGEEDMRSRRPHRELEVAEAQGRVEDEGWRLRGDGTRFWASTIITALRNSDGTLRGFAKITRDLTERRQSEETLRQSEELFRMLIASVHEYAIFMLDPSGRIATWNAGAHRIKQYTAEEIIGKHFSIFYTPEDKDKPARELEIAMRDGSVEDEGWRVRKDGSRFWANVVITAVFDESGELRGFAKVTRDITDRKMAEQALLEQQAARLKAEYERQQAESSYRTAHEANKAKDEFLMTLSHELRTPMTAILGWARLLPTMPPDDPSLKEAVRAISRSAQHQARLIDDVLDVSRIVSGKLRLAVETVDAVPILSAALDAVRPGAEVKGVQLRSDLPPDVGKVMVDPTRFQQIIWNLLSNAVKFTPRGGIVELVARRAESNLQVTVRDTGEGIDPGFLPHVFEQFRQAESSTTRVHGGLGLGLSIVRYLVEAHGGRIQAESKGKGQGAAFTITIPVAAMHRVQVAAAESVQEDDTDGFVLDRLDGLKILTVDDDDAGRELIAAVLRRAGASVVSFPSVAAGSRELETFGPDVIITDIALPDIDGFEFLRQLRQNPQTREKKIIALTAFSGRVTASEGGFDLALVKPVDPFALTAAIASLANR
jgi:PAS domain S-box-containing protein